MGWTLDDSSTLILATIFMIWYSFISGPNCAGITACVSNPCGDGEKCIANGDSYTCKCTDPTKCNIRK